MSSPAYDIATYLEAQTVGTVGTDIFVGELPTSPDNCIVLYDTAGRPSSVGDGTIYQPNIQVAIRNSSYAAAYTLAETIQGHLHGVSNTTLNSVFYLNIHNLQSPFSVGRDDNNRITLKQNFMTQKR